MTGPILNISIVKVLFDYEAQKEDELTIVVGDTIDVLKQGDDGWWEGKTVDGRLGYFPSTYVEKVESFAYTKSLKTTMLKQ